MGKINVESLPLAINHQNQVYFFFSLIVFVLAHLANAAFRALVLLSSAVSLAARVLPPFEPPIFPNATA
jgi:hypothetical protein